MAIPNLDDIQVYQQYDPDGMLARIHELPGQCQQAWQAALDFSLPPTYCNVNKVVILGMGGSAIGGDLVRGLALAEAKVPIFVQRDYYLPAFVDARTLVIASSYSGSTEEVLTSFGEALRTKARKLVMTTGGKLKEVAQTAKVPTFVFSYKAQPRAALAYGVLPLVAFLQKLGLIGDKSMDVAEMVAVLQAMSARLGETMPTANNLAKQMAQRLYGHLPVIYGADVVAEVAHRWKTQFNENSKAWAFYEVFPELDHNAVVGYQFPADLASKIRVVMLRSSFLEPRVRLRYEVTSDLLDRAGVGHDEVEGVGGTALSHLMSLVLFGDYVSYYLAILYGIDPSPVKVIDYLKAQLAKH